MTLREDVLEVTDMVKTACRGRGERKRGGGGRREMIVITDAQQSFLFTKCT